MMDREPMTRVYLHGDEKDENRKLNPWQADILVQDLYWHSAVGPTPAHALLRAAAHWDSYFHLEQRDLALRLEEKRAMLGPEIEDV